MWTLLFGVDVDLTVWCRCGPYCLVWKSYREKVGHPGNIELVTDRANGELHEATDEGTPAECDLKPITSTLGFPRPQTRVELNPRPHRHGGAPELQYRLTREKKKKV